MRFEFATKFSLLKLTKKINLNKKTNIFLKNSKKKKIKTIERKFQNYKKKIGSKLNVIFKTNLNSKIRIY